MGSLEAARISGFLCRLCSEMHRTVIHIYGDQGRKQRLAEKINEYLPVTVTPTDPLPKTICNTCISKVEDHHDLMQKILSIRKMSKNNMVTVMPKKVMRPLPTNADDDDDDDDDEDEEEDEDEDEEEEDDGPDTNCDSTSEEDGDGELVKSINNPNTTSIVNR